MKKLLLLIPIFLTACSEMYGPEQESTAVVNSEGIEIKDVTVTDNSITFTLAPKGEASYYSYLVDQSDAPQVLDSSAVYELGYEGAVATGTIKWTSETPSSPVTVNDLEPNTTYQIYAVAGSPTGVPSKVVVASAKTTDEVNPSAGSASVEDNVVTLSFSEGVTRGDGAVTVDYYATNTQEFLTDPKPVGSLIVAAEDIVSDGSSTVTITVNGAPAGAFYTVSLAAGAFKDSAGNPTPAETSGVEMTEEGPAPKGIYGYMPTASFEISPVEAESFTDPTEPITTTIDSEYDLAGYGEGNGSVVFQSSGKTTEIALTAGVDFGLAQGGLAIFLPEMPEPGDDVTLTIEEGAFLDIYGNGNAEWTATLKYSYGYTLDDVLGTYNVYLGNIFTGETGTTVLTIEESDNPESGNVMITTFMGTECQNPIYATFNVDAGTLTIAPGQPFAYADDNTIMYFFTCAVSGSSASLDLMTPTVFTMPESGVLSQTYYAVGYVSGSSIVDWDGYRVLDAVKGSSASSSISTCSTLKKVENRIIPLVRK